MMAPRAGLHKVKKSVRTAHGTVQRTYWTRGNALKAGGTAAGAATGGFLGLKMGRAAGAAAAVGVGIYGARMLHQGAKSGNTQMAQRGARLMQHVATHAVRYAKIGAAVGMTSGAAAGGAFGYHHPKKTIAAGITLGAAHAGARLRARRSR